MFKAMKAELLLILATLLAGAGWIFSKEALAGLPPLLFIGIRFFLAGVLLALFCRKDWSQLKEPSSLIPSVQLGGLMAVAMTFWILGLTFSSHLGEGAFISSLGVVLVPVVARLLFSERPPSCVWLALPIALTGLASLSLERGMHFEAGQWYFLLAALTFALQFNLVSRLSTRIPVMLLTSVQLVLVGVCVFLLSVLTERWPSYVPSHTWGWLAASIVLATSLRFLVQTWGQSLSPASHAAVIMNLEPVWAALLAVVWLNEVMGGWQWLGCSLIFVAMLVSRWPWVRKAFLSFQRYH